MTGGGSMTPEHPSDAPKREGRPVPAPLPRRAALPLLLILAAARCGHAGDAGARRPMSGANTVPGDSSVPSLLFGFESGQDFKDATSVIAQADQGGLGLPGRDYYLKDDAKTFETRKAYEEHVRRTLGLLGDPPE